MANEIIKIDGKDYELGKTYTNKHGVKFKLKRDIRADMQRNKARYGEKLIIR